MAARVQLKVDAEFPNFTQQLLQIVYPHYLSATPSMAVVEFKPDFAEAALAEGLTIPRDTVLRSLIAKGEQTACEYRTSQAVQLWPLQLAQLEYLQFGGHFQQRLGAGTVSADGQGGIPYRVAYGRRN